MGQWASSPSSHNLSCNKGSLGSKWWRDEGGVRKWKEEEEEQGGQEGWSEGISWELEVRRVWVRCEWSLSVVWGFHRTWLLLAEPTKHGGMCSWGWRPAATLAPAQLGLLSSYNPSHHAHHVLFLNQFQEDFMSVASVNIGYIDVSAQSSERIHLYIHTTSSWKYICHKNGCIDCWNKLYSPVTPVQSGWLWMIRKWTKNWTDCLRKQPSQGSFYC